MKQLAITVAMLALFSVLAFAGTGGAMAVDRMLGAALGAAL